MLKARFPCMNVMPVAKQAELARARRILKRLEDHRAAYRTAITGLSIEVQTTAMRVIARAIEEQRELIRRLEEETRNASEGSSGAS